MMAGFAGLTDLETALRRARQPEGGVVAGRFGDIFSPPRLKPKPVFIIFQSPPQGGPGAKWARKSQTGTGRVRCRS